MAIRKGDRITIGIAPVIQLAPFTYVKPSASITRDIVSGDEEGIKIELEQIHADLERILIRACLQELNLSSDLHAAVAEGSEGLANFCRKELNHEPQRQDLPAIPGKGDPAAQDRPTAKRTSTIPGATKQPTGPVRKGPTKR